jgi:hypothetical protein
LRENVRIDNEDTLAFSVLENIRPMIETAPLEQAADAYARMMQGKARHGSAWCWLQRTDSHKRADARTVFWDQQ